MIHTLPTPSTDAESAVAAANDTLRALSRDLAAGKLSLADLDPALVEQLRAALDEPRPRQRPLAYAGVGSRATPREMLAGMSDVAQVLGDAGFALSTGGADGADKAFEAGALRTDAPVTVHTPWPGYNGYRPGRDPESDIDVIHPQAGDAVRGMSFLHLARKHHPAWDRCRRGARALFLRNVSILAGALDDDGAVLPVRAVIAWNPNGSAHGRAAGGTGHTLRVAAELGIPVVNLSERTPPDRNADALAAIPAAMRRAILDRFADLPR